MEKLTMNIEFHAPTPGETQSLGERLGRLITGRLVVTLNGDLGSGKTTFVQGVARGLDVPQDCYVTSPTYTIINEYPGRLPLYHMDLYRLDSTDELIYLGLDEILCSQAVTIVEWPDLLIQDGTAVDLEITLLTDKNFHRKIIMNASGLAGTNLLKNLV